MCGLIGAVTDGVLFPAGRDTLDRIRHRGPDGDGWADLGHVVLGHTRLAVRGLGHGNDQPWVDGPITLTYNGELWNEADVQAVLPGPFTSGCDTETMARLIRERGADGLALADGMWAVVWADADGEVWAARDPWGRVPLYWNSLNGWASERKALDGPSWPVPPGHVLNVRTGRSRALPRPAWVTAPATPDGLLAALRRGVRERLASDRPIAIMLSGGLDSSLILRLAVDEGWEGQAYTAVLDPHSHDLAAARRVAEWAGVPLVEVPVPPPDPQRLAEAVHTVELSMKTQVEIALAHIPVAEAIRADGFAVCLSGEAADELFGGYGGMQIKAASADDEGYRQIKEAAVAKMARGNFIRVNKVMMRSGVEARLPFMDRSLVRMALAAGKQESPPGKRLLKQAAEGLLPEWVVHRPKLTFQGATGMASACQDMIPGNPVAHYNQIATDLFGYRPDDLLDSFAPEKEPV